MNRPDMLVAHLLDSKNSVADWLAMATLMLCWFIIHTLMRSGVSTQYHAEQDRCLCGPTVMSLHSLHHCTLYTLHTPTTPAPPPAVYFTQDPIIKL